MDRRVIRLSLPMELKAIFAEPSDYLAALIILVLFILKLFGVNHVVDSVLLMVCTYYFGVKHGRQNKK